MENLQNRIKSARMNKGLSQASLAQQTGVSQPTVANWENGSHIPRHAVLEKISDALGVEPIWLLSGEYTENETPAQAYMKYPIQHVPIYNWPISSSKFANTPAAGYIPFSSQHHPLFGLMTISADKQEYDVIICNSKDQDLRTPGRYLVTNSNNISVKIASQINEPKENILGRIIAHMNYYR